MIWGKEITSWSTAPAEKVLLDSIHETDAHNVATTIPKHRVELYQYHTKIDTQDTRVMGKGHQCQRVTKKRNRGARSLEAQATSEGPRKGSPPLSAWSRGAFSMANMAASLAMEVSIITCKLPIRRNISGRSDNLGNHRRGEVPSNPSCE